MTTWREILDAEIDPDSPITSPLMFALRDNLRAFAEGDPSAPRISPAALTVGGKGVDGPATNATVLTDNGFYDFESFVRTAAMTLPTATVIRVNGNLSITGCVITVNNRGQTDHPYGPFLFDYMQGQDHAGGGGGAGFGGLYQPAASYAQGYMETLAHALRGFSRLWSRQRPICGGNGGSAGSWGGGGLVIIVEGDADFSGSTINAVSPGGLGIGTTGGGGSIVVLCTGKITGGTFDASAGDTPVIVSGAGGGGYVALVADSFDGVRTKIANGGQNTSMPAYSGGPGVTEELQLAPDLLRSVLARR